MVFFIVPFTEGGLNYLWLIVLSITSISNLLFYKSIFLSKSKLTIIFLFILLNLIHIITFGSTNITSVILTIFLLFNILIFNEIVPRIISKQEFIYILKVFKFLIFTIYLLQVFTWKSNLPIINGYGITLENESYLRFNSLFPEPSVASFFWVLIHYLHYYLGNRTTNLRREIFFLVFVILFNSVFGIILGLIYYARILSKKYQIIGVAIISTIVTIYGVKYHVIERLSSFIEGFSLSSENMTSLALVEPSGVFRLAPLLYFFENLSFSYEDLFGHGAGVSSYIFNSYLRTIGYRVYDDSEVQLGFLPAFLVDYGIIFSLLFIFTFCRPSFKLKEHGAFFYLFIPVLMLNSNLNTQSFFAFIVFSTIAYKLGNESSNSRN